MAVFNVNNLQGWKHLPVDGIVFFYNDSDDNVDKVTVRNILEGASWSIEEIKSKYKDRNGVSRVVGLLLKGSITLLENKTYLLGALPVYMQQNNPVDIFIGLKGTYSNADESKLRFDLNKTKMGSFSTTVTTISSDGEDTKIKIDFLGRIHPDRLNLSPTYTL
ncbi:hypothetical protein KC717_06040 [Candidatus Dojkabacteria bacterium]|uniref:Uncharacterized protein n=1 Tax=Candidatus Dojkabacteria bacterium TaxID=2099670 RepID=A0A955L9V0_9BACT|nr:hypothetical protein [Candidatus Dojkabacteria bacterium]